MRLSVRKGDAGYRPLHICNKARVTLDGVQVRLCVTADEDLGEVRCLAEPIRVDASGTRALEVVYRGEVKITFSEGTLDA